jgi:hypothetical protein
MKEALINIERHYILRVGDTGTLTTFDGMEIVAITDEQAATIEASNDPLFLVDGELKTLGEMREIERLARLAARQEERFQSDPDAAKERKLNAFREAARIESESDIIVDGIGTFHVDARTLIHLEGIENLVNAGTSPILENGEYPNYKCVDGSFVNLGVDDMVTIREAIQGRDFGIYSIKLHGLTQAVMTASTFAELEAISW